MDPVELAAPENHAVWKERYEVFRTAAIMLKIMPSATIDEHRAHIGYIVTLYGSACWHIIARADQRGR